MAQDIFRRVSDLGGLLIVALVAPVPSASRDSQTGPSISESALEELEREANERNMELTEAFKHARKKPKNNKKK